MHGGRHACIGPAHSRVAAAAVVPGELAVDKPLEGGVAADLVVLGQVALLGGVDLGGVEGGGWVKAAVGWAVGAIRSDHTAPRAGVRSPASCTNSSSRAPRPAVARYGPEAVLHWLVYCRAVLYYSHPHLGEDDGGVVLLEGGGSLGVLGHQFLWGAGVVRAIGGETKWVRGGGDRAGSAHVGAAERKVV
jgi:hypothetical protein